MIKLAAGSASTPLRLSPVSPGEAGGLRLDTAWLADHGVFGLDHLDPRARSFILLRSQLINGFYGQGGRVLAVTSPQAGNGKTFVAANLATAMSRIVTTALVDLDLRQPALGERLGLAVERGTDDYLTGDAAYDAAVRRAGDLDLSIGVARGRRADASELLAGERLAALFARLREETRSGMCIVDTPPLLALDDILRIARHVDGVLMVVEEGVTRRRELLEAVRVLEPTPIVGTVLNKSIGGSRRRDLETYYYAR